MRDGVRVEFEQVVAELEKDTVDYDIGLASWMDAPESIIISFRIEPEKHEGAIKWLRELMWDSVFDKKVPDIILLGRISGDLLTCLLASCHHNNKNEERHSRGKAVGEAGVSLAYTGIFSTF